MATKHLVEELPPISLPTQRCHSSLTRQQSRIPFPKTTVSRANAPHELVFADICGPISPRTLGGSQHFLLIVDDYLRLMWVVTERIDVIVNCTPIRVNNKAKFSNLMIESRIEGYNGK